MKILIIGGPRFLGRHLVTSARARGHELTLFNRGKTNPDLFRRIATNIRGAFPRKEVAERTGAVVGSNLSENHAA